jgi:hypothetical protein
MKPKRNAKIVVLTEYDIAIAEFKHMRDYRNWLKQNKKEIKKVLFNKQLKTEVYMPWC